jgi:hypothetical protein
MKKVDFFLIGWPKTGSTSLHYYLSQHPDIFMSRTKESYFFCTDILNECDQHGQSGYYQFRSEAEYQELFRGSQPEQLLGESSVFYAISKDAIQNIKNHNPKAKLLIILRDPIELLDSWYSYLCLHSRETADSLEQALELQQVRRSGREWPANTQAPIHLRYDHLVDFPLHLKRIFSLVDQKSVKIIFYDEFKFEREKTVADTFSFLDVDPSFIPDFTEQNVSRKVKHGRLKTFIDRNKSSIVRALKPLGILAANGPLHRLYQRLFTVDERRAAVNTDRKTNLQQRYLPVLRETSELLQVDLIKKWNY